MEFDNNIIIDYVNNSEYAPFLFSYDQSGNILSSNKSFKKLVCQNTNLNIKDVLINFEPFFPESIYKGNLSLKVPDFEVFTANGTIAHRNDIYDVMCGIDAYEQLDLERQLFSTNQQIANLSRDLFKQKHQLEKLNKLKDEFVSMLSHDLRGPLRRVNSFAQLLEINLNLDKEKEEAGYLQFIRNESQLMHQMVVDILNFEAIESGKFKLNIEQINIHDLIKEMKDVFAQSLNEKSINLQLILKAADRTIEVDKVKVRQVLENILINCIKFSPEKEYVKIETADNSQGINIIISDGGPGFSEEDLAELFEPFRKGLAAGSNSESFGFGMSIVKKIVNSHGGSIKVENGKQGGAVFDITLPLTQ